MASKPAPKKAPPKATKPAARKKAVGIVTPVAIYALADPATGEIRYIGKANKPEERLKTHLRDAKRRSTPVYCWLRKLAAQGAQPVMRVLEWSCDWVEAERRLIAQHREAGARLLNVAEGGNEPACSKAQRAINGAVAAAKRNPAIWRYHRHLGSMLHYFLRAKNVEKAELIRAVQRLFDTLEPAQQQALGRRLGAAA